MWIGHIYSPLSTSTVLTKCQFTASGQYVLQLCYIPPSSWWSTMDTVSIKSSNLYCFLLKFVRLPWALFYSKSAHLNWQKVALAISMHWNVAILLVYLITCCLSTGPSDENEGKLANWGIGRRSLPKELWPNHTWLYMIPAAITAGASLPMLLEGILHMPSLPVLVMIYVRISPWLATFTDVD